jgi:hypothetical protein
MWVEHHNAQANTNNLNKTWAPQQTTGGKNYLILGSQGNPRTIEIRSMFGCLIHELGEPILY